LTGLSNPPPAPRISQSSFGGFGRGPQRRPELEDSSGDDDMENEDMEEDMGEDDDMDDEDVGDEEDNHMDEDEVT
jgi:hypothetical protein